MEQAQDAKVHIEIEYADLMCRIGRNTSVEQAQMSEQVNSHSVQASKTHSRPNHAVDVIAARSLGAKNSIM